MPKHARKHLRKTGAAGKNHLLAERVTGKRDLLQLRDVRRIDREYAFSSAL